MIKKVLLALSLLFTTPVLAQTPLPLCPSQLGACIAKHISTNATTAVKSGAGFLHAVTINTKGASSNVLTLYDNTAASGTVIATIDTTSASVTLTYDSAFSTGLTAVTATGTAADITITYR